MSKTPETQTETAVHVVWLLDRSGSMQDLAPDVIGGFNAFLAEQRSKPGKCRLTLVQFDTQDPQQVVHDRVKLAKVPDLDASTFVPRGGTPLRDALGRLLTTTAKAKHGETVMVIVYTDGMENASSDFGAEAIKQLVAAREAEGWVFTYLGSNQDAWAVAETVGISRAAAITYAPTPAGNAAALANVSRATASVRARAARGMRVDTDAIYAEVGRDADITE